MKKLFIAVFVLLGGALHGQNVETLAGENITLGGFGGPVIQGTSINGETSVLLGGEGAFLINHTFGIGGGGYGLINGADCTDNRIRKKLHFGYGGVKFYYISDYEKLFHITAGLLLGGGGVEEENEYDRDENEEEHEYGLLVIVPSLGVELNVVKFFRIGISANYRYVHGIDSPYYSDSDFSGFSASLFLKFGKF